jgi:hypothetical protein
VISVATFKIDSSSACAFNVDIKPEFAEVYDERLVRIMIFGKRFVTPQELKLFWRMLQAIFLDHGSYRCDTVIMLTDKKRRS